MKKKMVCLWLLCMVGGMMGCSMQGCPAGGVLLGEPRNLQQTEGLTSNEKFNWTKGRFTIDGEEVDLEGCALTVQGLLDLGFQTEDKTGYDIIGAPKMIVFTKNKVILEAAVISYEPCEFAEVKVFQIDSKGEINPKFEVDGVKLGSTQKEIQDKFGEPFQKSQQGSDVVWSYLADVENSRQFQYRLDLSFQDQVLTAISYTVGENHLIQF